MTAKMIAGYLHCHLTTVYRLIKLGKIPYFKLGGDLRFERAVIDKWIEKGGGALGEAPLITRARPPTRRTRIQRSV